MNIDKEYLEGQLATLKKQQEQHLANANAVIGAIQAHEQLLAYLELPEPANAAD